MRSIPDLLARRAASLAVTEAVDLPFAAAAQVTRPSPEWLRLARLARALAWASLGWLAIEGTVGVVAGVVAGSIALVGFGLDSAIEGESDIRQGVRNRLVP